MTLLPFKREPKKASIVDIGNDEIGVLSVPRYGCLTVNETIAVTEMLRNISNNTALTEMQLESAAILLRSRINKDLTLDDIKAATEDPESNIRMPLIEALYEFFFEGERTKWAPKDYLLKLEGNGAEEACTNYAGVVGAIAAFEKPVNEADKPSVYYVFKSGAELPETVVRVDGVQSAPKSTQAKQKSQTGQESISS